MRFVGLLISSLATACAAAGTSRPPPSSPHEPPSNSSTTDVAPAERSHPRLVSTYGSTSPDLDGQGTEQAWQRARPLQITTRRVVPPLDESTTTVELSAVHTDSHLYLLARWQDATCDNVDHKPWVWNDQKGAYEEGPDREDMFSVAFEHTGLFDANMLSGQEAVWDVWHWKATRTNPAGYAMDRSHRYTRQEPEDKAKAYSLANGGGQVWIARPEDSGDTIERKQPAPASRQGDRVAQYVVGTPTGSAADVSAKGACSDGWWTLELGRKLNTGHPDDTAFNTRQSYRFAVATHDRTGDMDKASGVLDLVFDQG